MTHPSTPGSATLRWRIAPPGALGTRRAARLVERSLMVYRRTWFVVFSGFFEPLFYLFSIGVGIDQLVGDISGPGGDPLTYREFVAPALLASAAMNGAVYDSTFNVFFKLKHAKTYDAVLATPVGVGDVALGEISWALLRGSLYAVGFLVVMGAMGIVASPLALLALPGALLIGFAFAAVGLAATTWVRSWQDFGAFQLVILPLFLFSATFFPLATYPGPLQVVVQLTPLYHGVDLVRSLTAGVVDLSLLVHAGYLGTMGLAGLIVASRRLERLLLR